jgi:sigma-E factor negative regulatory protein RseA
MTPDSERREQARLQLSALLDGELAGDELTAPLGAWRDDARQRADWHAYSVIGDVLRSDELASDPARDAEFLQVFRSRMSTEPIVLAPTPARVAPAGVAGARARRSWFAPTALAAGFVAVAGVAVLWRTPLSSPEQAVGASLAAAPSPSPVLRVADLPSGASAVAATGAPAAYLGSGNVIRDARLERYLDAHQQFAGTSAFGVPSGFLRSAATVNPADR